MMRFSKTRLARPLVLAGLAAMFALAIGATAQADSISYVRPATFELSTAPTFTTNNINVISGVTSGAGSQFINGIFAGGGNPFPNTGGTFRTVGANLLNKYTAQNGVLTDVLFNGMPVDVVFAVQGTTTSSVSGSPMFTITGGRAGLFTTTNFNGFDPRTWGTTAGTSLATPIAVYDIKLPPERVVDNVMDDPVDGGTHIFNLAPNQVNQASVNTTVGSANQGFFLLKQSLTYTTPTALAGGSAAGSNYENVTNKTPPSGTFVDQGIVTRADESIQDADANGNASFYGAAGFLDALNIIAKQLGGLTDLGSSAGVGTAFATGLGGLGNNDTNATDYNPSTGQNFGGARIPNTNDLIETFGTTSSPTIQASTVPEPASVTMLLCGGLAAAGIAGIRRFRMKYAMV
jgi:hypothetical protein